jgi:hypothetical protein
MRWYHNSGGYKLTRIICLWLLVGMVLVPSTATTYGFELPQEIIAFYLHNSLGYSEGVVRKFSKTGPLATQRKCISSQRDKCSKAVLDKRMGDSLWKNNRIKVKVTSQNPDIKFIFADATVAVSERRELSYLYIGGFNDSDDADCQLYYSIKDNVIEKVVIVVSLDSPELKQKLCLTSQLMQGLGLSLPSNMPFSRVWEHPGVVLLDGQNAFTDDNVSGVTMGESIFSYIHMCSDIKPGMKADDIRRILSGNSVCTYGLEPLPEKQKT